MKIYTKTGDAGETSLLGGRRVSKDCQEMEAIGEIDELNALVGVLVSEMGEQFEDQKKLLVVVQHKLFNIGGLLADVQSGLGQVPDVKISDIDSLEKGVDCMEKELEPLTEFILPGGNKLASVCFYVRAVCRRAERRVISVSKKYENLNPNVQKYLNRLSDLLFVMGRFLNRGESVKDVVWRK